MTSSDPTETVDHRARLIDALATTLTRQSYADTTIADLVAQAHVSKRTFYEQFSSKDECLVALCETLSQRTLGIIALGFDPQADWVEQLSHVTHAYLASLQAEPVLIRTLFIELLGIGPAGLSTRRQIQQRFADFLQMQVELSRAKEPGKRALSPEMAMAVVGGINELILHAIEQDQAHQLTKLAPTVIAFVQAVLMSLNPEPD
ncbi:TetR/AcrR family transcriptional regulator [Aquabacterium sp.]|uniref:TetR/AcrR family transcriptional regulator n=1 Tax=Aquabacterium sp. TaxID=1872578 RepID=UPI002487E961|nr:TetR/AcrR family transcriptional regulator [Aquabacterium sp.]MDI1257695.1 TetR/AcrR family transcriptional regulator [Aquabacterium sp.]